MFDGRGEVDCDTAARGDAFESCYDGVEAASGIPDASGEFTVAGNEEASGESERRK